MMRDQLKHFLATVSVFLVSIGLMGMTPKKSEAAGWGTFCVVMGFGGAVGLGAYCIYDAFFDMPALCTTGANCASKPTASGGGCVNTNACNGQGQTGCACGPSKGGPTDCACKPSEN
jgi:hypothetical protein